MERKVFLDSASTTYVNAEVLQEMLPVFDTVYGNANSLHNFGRAANELLDKARDRVAKAINAKASEIYFTSGGTEANNWAIKGLVYANNLKGNHIITSQIEHDSVLETFKELEHEGFRVTYLPVDKNGIVNLANLMHVLSSNTILVSIMTANNEVGTIQHINAISKTVKEKGILFHTDAVQAFSNLKIDVKELNVDAMTLSSHKIYGPKGIGALYVKRGVKIKNLLIGGSQEFSKRAGTVNVPAAVGFGKAAELAIRDMKATNDKTKNLRDYFIRELKNHITGIHINGHPIQRLPHIANVSFDYIDGESIMLMLDLDGIAVSTGAACSSGDTKESHVLRAMGVPTELIKNTIRFSFTKRTTKEEINYVIEKLEVIVKKLRDISPLTKRIKKER
ncbi:MAG: cysteine desulfurase family protein [Clostridia bacterium]|nr:cysteine desulfurase family protein [Clostridia bacterium]